MRVIDKFAEALTAAGLTAKVWQKANKLRVYIELPKIWLYNAETKRGAVSCYFDYDQIDQADALAEFDWRDDVCAGSVFCCWVNARRSVAYDYERATELRSRVAKLLIEHGLAPASEYAAERGGETQV